MNETTITAQIWEKIRYSWIDDTRFIRAAACLMFMFSVGQSVDPFPSGVHPWVLLVFVGGSFHFGELAILAFVAGCVVALFDSERSWVESARLFNGASIAATACCLFMVVITCMFST